MPGAFPSVLALWLILPVAGIGTAVEVDRAMQNPKSDDPSELADHLNREHEVLEKLASRLNYIESQVSNLIEVRRRGTWLAGEDLHKMLADAPTVITTKNLRLERTLSDNDLIYSISAKNASVLQIFESIAKTSARELNVHTDVSREHLAGRIHLALHGIDILELVEIVAGTQGLEVVVDARSITVGSIRALSDRPMEERLREIAVAAYQRALLRYPGSPEAPAGYLGIGRYHQATGFHTAAIQTAETVLQRYPDSTHTGAAFLMIANSQEMLRRYDAARASYYRYVDSYPAAKGLAAIMIKIGHTLIQEGKHPQAIAIYEEVIRDYPKSKEVPRARLQLATCLFKAKKYEKAIAQLKVVEQSQPNLACLSPAGTAGPQLDFMIVECLTSLKQYARARARLKKIIERSPSLAVAEKAYYSLGDTFLAEDNAVAAIEAYQGAARSFPDGVMQQALSLRLCRAYLKIGLYLTVENRLKTLSPATLRLPQVRPILVGLAQYLLESGDYGQALALLTDPRWPHDADTEPDILILRARGLLAASRLDEALKKASTAARLAKDRDLRSEAFRLIGDCYLLKQEPIAAATAYGGEMP